MLATFCMQRALEDMAARCLDAKSGYFGEGDVTVATRNNEEHNGNAACFDNLPLSAVVIQLFAVIAVNYHAHHFQVLVVYR